MTTMPAASTPKWNRLEPDERRTQILAAAVRLFGDKPYAEVSMADVAAAAGVARGLIHHYIGSKRDLYLECVRFLVTVPPIEDVHLPTGSVEERARGSVHWLVGVIEAHGTAWVSVASGSGVDQQVAQILDEADDLAAERVLDATAFETHRGDRRIATSAVRAFGGMVKAAGREWLVRGTLTRDQVETLLTDVLVTVLSTARSLDNAPER
ncbi:MULTISPECIES: TetR/AcrR family transcriptional regulator [Nocardiaceae]|jgi:AcrR family transcriptional regulator|uniref:TetR/AcrR family transcriptional regulator n=1 Tax=Nocardiaceae TaxID=85025 RepID=UPI00061FBD1C|nr:MULTISPECIES: TetR/AcrR family transcriptional regulator [Rhodococcus]KJV01926.1 putative TetR family transcriptional regulator [Rhodococcus sp. PML026]MDP9638393.1 AcrR family transcriptional regulator [Rhodococcus cercidiphylli]MDQ0280289.1 AcrR family transcriptional regulator [Rhodococcus fascians]